MNTSEDNKCVELRAALHALMDYFKSGNAVPVERATILTSSKEVQAALKVLG